MSASRTATNTPTAGSLRVGLVFGLALLGCDADPPAPQFDRAARYAEIQAMCAKPDLPRCRPGELIICGTVEDQTWVHWGEVLYSGDTYWLEGPQEEEKTLVLFFGWPGDPFADIHFGLRDLTSARLRGYGIGIVVDGTPVYSLWECDPGSISRLVVEPDHLGIWTGTLHSWSRDEDVCETPTLEGQLRICAGLPGFQDRLTFELARQDAGPPGPDAWVGEASLDAAQ
jgi:hypothetical protein